MLRADTLAADWPALDLNRRADTLRGGFTLTLGPLSDAAARDADAADRAATGLRQRDTSVWSKDSAVQKKIADRLGWLTSPALMAQSIDRLTSFAASIRQAGFTDAVLLGMGGSSLAPEVLRATLGSAPGFPVLHVLDSTDPAAVLSVDPPLATTLFILASKSGSTIEPNSLAAYYIKRLTDAGIADWGQHFIAITDEGTDLARRAQAQRFRDVFINPSDIGGRYSALSFFGMVPAALMGQNVRELTAWGLAMLVAAGENGSANPATPLGLLMGAGARNSRDKMTLFLPPELETFGLWVEQLVAESPGKRGVGVLPVVGEPLDPAVAAASDRVFASIAVGDTAQSVRLPPSFSSTLPVKEAIAAEFVRWEIATAVAGSLLGINPFDEPNVQQAKDATRVLLDRFKAEGRLPLSEPDHESVTHIACTLSQTARSQGPVDRFLARIRPGDYLAILAYLGPDPDLLEALQAFRMAVHQGTGVATTFGYGPRYLHSTGQLHKGGPDNGVFVIVTATPQHDIDIPGEAFSFGTLELAQALGDFNALEAGGRRALHIHLPAPTANLIREACAPLLAGLAPADRVGTPIMQLGFIGLGKMGLNMVTRLVRGGHEIVAFDRNAEARAAAAAAGARPVESLDALAGSLTSLRAVWLMIPSGDPTESTIAALSERLAAGDTIVDGGNSDFRDDVRRAATLAERGIHYIDAGTSGGIWGLKEGYCLMVGGVEEACRRLEPVFHTLAPEDGYLRVGEPGAGHFVKMVHNGIEYGLMQAYAEGFELLHASPFNVDLPKVASLWMHGSVVRSWLLELAARALGEDPGLEKLTGYVEDSGEGRWMLREGIDHAVPLPVLAAALFTRFRSRTDNPFSERLLAALRQQFGGHSVKRSPDGTP